MVPFLVLVGSWLVLRAAGRFGVRQLDSAAASGRAALAELPVTTKAELLARQASAPPFGGFAAAGSGGAEAGSGGPLRLFASPGPIYEFETARADYWRGARALYAAGFRAGSSYCSRAAPCGSAAPGSAG